MTQTGAVTAAILVIGEVVTARGALDWFESRPLFGRRVVVTQRSDLARPTVARLREEGAEVLEIPATRWRLPSDLEALDQALHRLDDRDWVLFSHPFAVDHFLQRLVQSRGDLRALGRARLGAYGPATGAALRAWHLRPDAVSADHKTPLILDAVMRGGDVGGKRFLVVRGEVATERVPEVLTERGAVVEVVAGGASGAPVAPGPAEGVAVAPALGVGAVAPEQGRYASEVQLDGVKTPKSPGDCREQLHCVGLRTIPAFLAYEGTAGSSRHLSVGH